MSHNIAFRLGNDINLAPSCIWVFGLIWLTSPWPFFWNNRFLVFLRCCWCHRFLSLRCRQLFFWFSQSIFIDRNRFLSRFLSRRLNIFSRGAIASFNAWFMASRTTLCVLSLVLFEVNGFHHWGGFWACYVWSCCSLFLLLMVFIHFFILFNHRYRLVLGRWVVEGWRLMRCHIDFFSPYLLIQIYIGHWIQLGYLRKLRIVYSCASLAWI